MKTEVSRYLPGGNPPKRRFRKPFPLGAPQALIAPLEGILEAARTLSGALRTAVFAVEGREITLVASRGGEPGSEPPPSRIAARALASGSVIAEEADGSWIRAIPIAEEPAPGSERRRLKPRSTLTSACLVLEGSLPIEADRDLVAAVLPVTRALLAALDARAFADAVATDGSTGALSRPAFERAATNELAIAAAAERPAALVLLEVIPRKPGVEVETAEDALAAAASALRKALRSNDLLGRRGPDELAALLVDADPDSVPATAERLLRRVAAALEPLGMEPPVLGASAFPAHGATFETLDAAALDALESARSAGSGAFKVYDPALGRSPTACRRSFFTGDPGLDARKAALLFESVLAANGAREIRDALDAVLRALLAATGADRAAVLSGDGQKLEVTAARDHDWAPLDAPLRFSRSACLRALALGRAICVTDTNEARVPLGSSAQDLHLRSIVVVPLLGREGALGALYADSLRPSLRTYGPEELAYLEALAAQAALAIENAEMRERLEEENAALRRAARKASTDAPVLLGTSDVFRRSLEHLPEIVEGSSSVLILGESGTGKELLARAIHELGPRSRGSFIAQNCAAIPTELLESELFGHASGAFSGAGKSKRGLIELAAQGTFFLDEVGDLPLGLQAKLLRVLEDKEVRRIGETRGSRVDFRLICATNRDLRREVDEGRFRRDLYYRINVFTVTLPPLRERASDVPELTRHFVARAAARLGRPQPEVSREAQALLERCPWPGNVRELANVLEKATALARDGRIEPAHLGLETEAGSVPLSGALRERLAALERDLVADALRSSDGNVSAAARVLGIARQQLQRLMRKYRLRPARG